ncbi:Pex12 amino terminal region-domain-containing protein [Aspergillus unguis]
MNRALLRAPRRYREVTRVLPSVSPASRSTFLSYNRVRTLTSNSHLSTEHPPPASTTPGTILAEENEAQKPESASASSQHIPWYLQEEAAVPAAAEVTSREQLPELPENPPKILPDLLEYVFKDLGLDELKLIDLRGLETPAALGANVIMVIGTARSVKHLNVSADRLCRWLRSNYKLSPYADGLLGRNELKIKLRRKTRRARLASRSGQMFDEKDDGITTGWICVNAGVVEKDVAPEEAEGRFEGFGPVVGGTRVVVQLFTEEKRAELDLEGLWEGRIKRANREKEKHSDVAKDAAEEVRYSDNTINSPPSDISPNVPRSPSIALPHEQRRHFSSRSHYPGSRFLSNVAAARQHISHTRGTAKPVENENQARSSRDMLAQYMSTLSDEDLGIVLGDNPDDPNSTDFLRLFHSSLSDAPQDALALAQLKLICFAYSQGHTKYSRESIHKAFMGCCISASELPEQTVFQVVDILLTPRTGDNPNGPEWFTESDRDLAISVLEQLSLQGMDFMTLQMFTRLYSLACLPTDPSKDDGLTPAKRGSHVLRMIETLDIPFDPVEARTLMLWLFQNGDYDAFWKWWRKLPLKNSPRTSEDYEMIFRLHAGLGDSRAAQKALTWVPMMRRESPPISIEGDMVAHVKDCLILAHSRIEELANKGATLEYAELWRECQAKLASNSYLPSLQQEFDDLKPSLFELLAEQQLSDLLPPSIRYILAVATHRHPRYLLRVLNSYDEVYALLSLIVERYYLRNFGGSFTENFYSLKRERVLLTKNGEIPRAQLGAPGPVRESLKLRTADVWKNLFVMVGIPYLKRKLDEGYDIHAAPQASLISSGGPRYNPSDELPPNPTIRQRLMHAYKWFLRNVYPSVNAAYYFSILAFNLAYLFDNTKYSSPFLWLIGTRIRRLSSADHHAIAKILEDKPQTPRGGRRAGSGLLGLLSPHNLYPQLLTSLRYFLPASIFALKFLEWWHASDFSRQLARKATDTLDIPAPITKGMIPPSERKKKPSTSTTEKQDTVSPKSALKSSSPNKRPQPPISASSYLPIFTVALPPADSDAAKSCPICLNELTNPTACQTGYVYCYVCIFHWLNGEHQRQLDFMNGEGAGAAWEDAGDEEANGEEGGEKESTAHVGQSREGKWESGKGRCPVTGRKVLGGTEGLRRVLI